MSAIRTTVEIYKGLSENCKSLPSPLLAIVKEGPSSVRQPCFAKCGPFLFGPHQAVIFWNQLSCTTFLEDGSTWCRWRYMHEISKTAFSYIGLLLWCEVQINQRNLWQITGWCLWFQITIPEAKQGNDIPNARFQKNISSIWKRSYLISKISTLIASSNIKWVGC